MSRYPDVDPQDIDPDTGAPYSNYSSPSLDTSFHDGEMDVEDSPAPIAALRTAHAWLERWARHVGSCQGGQQCTCGLTAIQSEAAIAIQNHDFPEENPQ